MAEAINTGGIRPVTLPNQFPPMPTVARILSRFDRDQLTSFIAVAIDLADSMDGDPDIEDDDPAEAIGDEKDAAWVEWRQMRGSQKRGPNIVSGNEDDEEDDPAEEDDPSGQCDEDEINTNLQARWASRPGCSISDPDEDDDPAGGNVTDEPHDEDDGY